MLDLPELADWQEPQISSADDVIHRDGAHGSRVVAGIWISVVTNHKYTSFTDRSIDVAFKADIIGVAFVENESIGLFGVVYSNVSIFDDNPLSR